MSHSPDAPNGQVFIVSAARTPIGKFGGSLADVSATTLGGIAIGAAVERSGRYTSAVVGVTLCVLPVCLLWLLWEPPNKCHLRVSRKKKFKRGMAWSEIIFP